MTNIFNDFDPYIWKKDLQYIYEVEKIISEACGHKKVGTYVGKYVILCLVEYFDFDIQIQKYHQKYLIHKKDFERCTILKKNTLLVSNIHHVMEANGLNFITIFGIVIEN